jgi:predicted enzyme related to lactoylglutathione lyase
MTARTHPWLLYRDTVGFEVRNDVGYGGMPWHTVGPADQPGTSTVLEPPAADLVGCRRSVSRLAVRLETTVHTGSMRPATSGVTMTGSSTQGIKTVLHPVSDLATAKAVYAALLGVPPQTDESYYVGFEAAGQHIGLVPGGGPQGMTSPVAYWHVPDIEAKLAEVTAAGATVKEPAHDVGGGRLVATVTDPDGNVLGLLQDR